MAREKTFFIGNEEDIAEYYHSVITGVVKVSVGIGITEEGEFKFFQPQNFEVYEITSELYNQLLSADSEKGKPAGTFRKTDLWEYIDIIRNNSTREKVSQVDKLAQVDNGLRNV